MACDKVAEKGWPLFWGAAPRTVCIAAAYLGKRLFSARYREMIEGWEDGCGSTPAVPQSRKRRESALCSRWGFVRVTGYLGGEAEDRVAPRLPRPGARRRCQALREADRQQSRALAKCHRQGRRPGTMAGRHAGTGLPAIKSFPHRAASSSISSREGPKRSNIVGGGRFTVAGRYRLAVVV
jgi:hypothetical protein